MALGTIATRRSPGAASETIPTLIPTMIPQSRRQLGHGEERLPYGSQQF